MALITFLIALAIAFYALVLVSILLMLHQSGEIHDLTLLDILFLFIWPLTLLYWYIRHRE